jgi:hypothetical protein
MLWTFLKFVAYTYSGAALILFAVLGVVSLYLNLSGKGVRFDDGIDRLLRELDEERPLYRHPH